MQLRARLLAAEIAVAGREPRFWGIVARNLVPVIGVFVLGWPAFLAVAYFVVETWLFFSLILAAEISVDPAYGGSAELSAEQTAQEMLKRFLIYAPFTAILLGLLTWPLLMAAIHAERWEKSLVEAMASGLRPADVAVALGLIFGTLAIEAFRLARRFHARSEAQRREDDLRQLSMMLRVVCMTGAGPLFFLLLLLVPTGYANRLIVVLIAATSVWLEGMPHHATKYLGVVAKARRTLFRKR